MLKIWKKYSFIVLLLMVIGGLFDFRIGLAAIVCMVAPIIISFFNGRFWCGNLCPRGNFYDNVVSKFSKHKKVPKFLRSYTFRIIVIIVMMTAFTLGIKKNWGNIYGIGFVFYRMIVVTTLIGIVLSFFYNERSWCNFCPMGTIASIITKILNKDNGLKISSSCVSCKICEKTCPMSVTPYEYKDGVIKNPDCIKCLRCVYKCPKKSISK